MKSCKHLFEAVSPDGINGPSFSICKYCDQVGDDPFEKTATQELYDDYLAGGGQPIQPLIVGSAIVDDPAHMEFLGHDLRSK